MNDRGFCPPNTIGKDFSNNFVQQETIQNTLNGFSPYDSTTTTTIQVQNGHFGEGPGTSMPYRDTSPMKPMYQHGNASYTPPSYANITAPKNFDPYGYRTQHQQRNISYNVHQQKNPNLVPGSRQPNNFAEEHHSRPSVGFGEFSSQNSGGNTSFGARPSSHPPPFLPNEIPSFHSPASQRSLQQHFGTGGAINQTISDYSIPTGGPNFDMMLYDGGMNGTGNGHQMMMNGGGEFLGDFGPSRDMPAQYVLSNELLCRIDNSTKKQSLLELQIGLEQIAYETTTNFNTWATVIKDRLNVTGRDSLSEMDKFIATEMLVEMSIVLDESQYNFSRLCQFLATNIDKYGPNILLPQVSAFVSETNTLLSPQHLRNLVTFLAELYDKIEINGVKSSQLAAHLFDQLHNVLKLNPLDDQSIGTIVKILKLTGRFLENDRGPQAMDEFFAELGEVSRNSSDSAKSKVKNLVALRDKQWGIVAETITSGNSSAYPLVGILGPDGEQLTEEECNLFDDTFDNFGNSPSGSLYNNPMEEDNVEDDYEQFLQATAIRAAEKALEKVSIDEDDESILSSPKLFSGKQL